MKKVHIEVGEPQARNARSNPVGAVRGIVAHLFYWLLAHYYFLPGLYFHRYSSLLGLSLAVKGRSRMPGGLFNHLLRGGFEATHYLEFDFFWKRLRHRHNLGDYLDVSSPRIFPVVLLHKRTFESATLINPDAKDLSATAELIRAAGLDRVCRTVARGVEDVGFRDESFDVITSVSTLQHVWKNSETVAAIWRYLRPGGTLLISLPCATDATEQHHQQPSHTTAVPPTGRPLFRQLYDSRLIDERVFKIVGPPTRYMIYGETTAGSFGRRLSRKLSDPTYPHWREPLIMGREWRCFSSINELPGEGITALEFTKPEKGRQRENTARALGQPSAAFG
jgi:SAM-dependent methyltransferase